MFSYSGFSHNALLAWLRRTATTGQGWSVWLSPGAAPRACSRPPPSPPSTWSRTLEAPSDSSAACQHSAHWRWRTGCSCGALAQERGGGGAKVEILGGGSIGELLNNRIVTLQKKLPNDRDTTGIYCTYVETAVKLFLCSHCDFCLWDLHYLKVCWCVES